MEEYDSETVTTRLGCIAQETTDSAGVWEQIGANWAVSRTLIANVEAEAGQKF